jgi:hypothetical protein
LIFKRQRYLIRGIKYSVDLVTNISRCVRDSYGLTIFYYQYTAFFCKAFSCAETIPEAFQTNYHTTVLYNTTIQINHICQRTTLYVSSLDNLRLCMLHMPLIIEETSQIILFKFIMKITDKCKSFFFYRHFTHMQMLFPYS